MLRKALLIVTMAATAQAQTLENFGPQVQRPVVPMGNLFLVSIVLVVVSLILVFLIKKYIRTVNDVDYRY
jgi:hypothetical protein